MATGQSRFWQPASDARPTPGRRATRSSTSASSRESQPCAPTSSSITGNASGFGEVTIKRTPPGVRVEMMSRKPQHAASRCARSSTTSETSTSYTTSKPSFTRRTATWCSTKACHSPIWFLDSLAGSEQAIGRCLLAMSKPSYGWRMLVFPTTLARSMQVEVSSSIPLHRRPTDRLTDSPSWTPDGNDQGAGPRPDRN